MREGLIAYAKMGKPFFEGAIRSRITCSGDVQEKKKKKKKKKTFFDAGRQDKKVWRPNAEIKTDNNLMAGICHLVGICFCLIREGIAGDHSVVPRRLPPRLVPCGPIPCCPS